MHADLLGDSFLLSELAAQSKAKNIVMQGHFMAESADILTWMNEVILPNMRTGCSMADMAALNEEIVGKNSVNPIE